MKTIFAMLIGALITIGLLFAVISSNEFVLNTQTLLQSPKVNVKNSSSIIDDINGINTHSKVNTNVEKESQSESSMGDFTQLIKNNGIVFGTVSDGATIIVPCSEGTIVNEELVVPEYYPSMPWEKFTDYIEYNGGGNYTVDEYYNGINTGEFNLNQDGTNMLVGTFKHMQGSNKNMSFKASFKEESLSTSGELEKKPFYIGVIGNTAVTLTNLFNGSSYTEYYHGDKHLFMVKKANVPEDSNYSIELDEYDNSKLTGKYLLNDVGNDTYTGIFERYIKGIAQKPITVGLTGSNSPFGV